MTQKPVPVSFARPSWKGKKNDDDDKGRKPPLETVWNVAAAALPSWTAICLKTALGMTIALYVLNQKHLLPKPLSAVVSKALFWPSMPITVARRIGVWSTVVDDVVIIGGAPFGFAQIPEKLHEVYGVGGVVNLCKEYRGPISQYRRLSMKELYLPTVDHFEPTVEDLESAVQFIKTRQAVGERVYVHCRAGHGRSAAVVLAWLMTKDPNVDVKTLNEELCQIRNVRSTLWKQQNIKEFHSRLVDGKCQ